MMTLAERLADRASRKADNVGIDAPASSTPSSHEAARAEAVAKLGYDPHALAGVGSYDPHASKVPN